MYTVPAAELIPPDWMYEPAGAVHDATTATEDTLYLANVHGPVIFHKPDGSLDYVQDWRTIKGLAEQANRRAT